MEPDDFVDERGTPAGDKQQHHADPRKKRTATLYRLGIQLSSPGWIAGLGDKRGTAGETTSVQKCTRSAGPASRGSAPAWPLRSVPSRSGRRLCSPSSTWAFSRPRKITEKTTLSLSSRNSLARLTLVIRSWSPILGRSRSSLFLLWCVWPLCCRFFCWYLNLPKSMMRQTGGFSVGATSTKSSPAARACCNASSVLMTPSWAPS